MLNSRIVKNSSESLSLFDGMVCLNTTLQDHGTWLFGVQQPSVYLMKLSRFRDMFDLKYKLLETRQHGNTCCTFCYVGENANQPKTNITKTLINLILFSNANTKERNENSQHRYIGYIRCAVRSLLDSRKFGLNVERIRSQQASKKRCLHN